MKKLWSLLLAFAMVCSLIPVAALAAEGVPMISFETTFTSDMKAGHTFTVTANMDTNTGIVGIGLPLTWNDEVLRFDGFNVYPEDNFLVSDVLEARGWSAEYSNETALVTGARTTNNTTTGSLFTANFTIIGSGDLEIGFATEGERVFNVYTAGAAASDPNVNITDATYEAIDWTNVSGLSVAGEEPVGPVIPDDAPFTAITTDAGAVIAIEQQEDVEANYVTVPYYIVTIPEDAETVYLTAPDQVVMEDMNTGTMQATGYAFDVANDWSALYISYNYEESDEGPIVEIPMNMVASDWSGEVELCFVEDEDGYLTHAFGIEDANYACLGAISFRYGTAPEGGEEETTYAINVNQTTGGTVTVYNEALEEITEAAEGDCIYVEAVASDGYSFKQLYIDGEAVELGMTNGFYTMPAKEITVSADFEAVHTCVYDQETVAEKYLKSEANCTSAAVYYKSCTCGEFDNSESAATFTYGETAPNNHNYVDGECQWCHEKEVVGFHFATSADVSAENGGTAVVHVKITGHSDPSVTKYNAYDITMTYDSDKLEYQSYDGAVKSDSGRVEVDAENGTIRIVGCGADKEFDTEIAALTFKTKAEGEATVTINKVQVSDKEESVKEDAPEATPKHEEEDPDADETPDVSVVVVPYSVTKPDYVSGNDKVLHGETYTFSYTDTTNYTYTGLTVKVGGTAVTPTEEDGVYTIANVTGAIEITVTQTPNSYDVTFNEENTATVEGSNTATYGTNYVFTVTPSEGMKIASVTVTGANNQTISYTINENGEYVIEGTDITGAFTITVTETDKDTTVTFTGIEASEIEGGSLTMTAEIGKAFPFKLIKKEGFGYTVKVGETELTESEEVAGQFTIPAELVVKGGVQVDITKKDTTKPVIDVTEYINLDGKVMFLVTAKWRDRVLAYGDNTMYWSPKYTVTGETEAGAYCWLVISTDEMNTVDLVKTSAEDAIVVAAEGASVTSIQYNCDINGTTRVDVNDAQLAYDMYNASYMEFTENLPMKKFLEADMETDSKLDTKDTAAIINYIVSGANA
ncbi:MAG: hypothetical protein IKA47_07985 [Oscillospiraceae bacterium]|nr:hypothetical protein [Oscillospiraceae bacterium]